MWGGSLLPPHTMRSCPSPLAAVAIATTAVVARRARLTGRGVLRPLDQHVRHDEAAVLVLGHELEADATPLLVDLLHDDIDDVTTRHHIFDMPLRRSCCSP